MEVLQGNVYNVKEFNNGHTHVFEVGWIGGGSFDVKVLASTTYKEGASLNIKNDSLIWHGNTNWMLKKGTNPVDKVEVALTDHHKQVFIDLALLTKDWEWLKELTIREAVN